MNLIEATFAAVARASLVALLCLLGSRFFMRRDHFLLLLAGAIAWLTPAMLAGYGWLSFAAAMPIGSWQRETLYTLAVTLRLLPLALLLLRIAPERWSPAAQHLAALTPSHSTQWRLRLRHTGPAPFAAFAVTWLLAFQEFDLATSWNIRTWTVAIFDAQVGGLPTSDTLWLITFPILCQSTMLPILVPTLRAMLTHRCTYATYSTLRKKSNAAMLPAAALLLGWIAWPGFQILSRATFSAQPWIESLPRLHEAGIGLLVAIASALLAWLLARLAWKKRLFLVLALPGLAGPLVLALLTLALSNDTSLRETPLPWLLTLALTLLPFALLLERISTLQESHDSTQVAQLLAARPPLWRRRTAPTAASIAFLVLLGYADFMIASLLAPPSLTPALARIFNLMHYGQTAVLSASVTLSIALPLIAFVAIGFLLHTLSHAR